MATLRITVQIGGISPLEDTRANRQRILVFSGSTPLAASTGNIGGNIRARSATGSYAYDLNGPRIPGTIAVTSFSPAQFLSADLLGQPSLVAQLGEMIESGHIIVVDEAAPGVPLTRTNLSAYL